MSSYFDHFILIQVLNWIITDSMLIFLSILFIWLIMLQCYKLISSYTQLIINFLFEHWFNLIRENLGKKYSNYFYPIITLFFFLLTINLFGFYLYSFPSTTHINLTFGIAFSFWLSIIFLGFFKYKSSFFSIFMPNGAPINLSFLLVAIEIISNFSRPIALGMRLAANLTAGHILLAILADFSIKLLLISTNIISIFPFFIIIFMTGLEIGVLFIQAYVFCLLLSIYLKDSLELH